MRTTETRPLPVNKTAVIRSAFFALAKIGAQLHSYDEQQGIVTATIGRIRIGGAEFFEQEIEISVDEHEETSFLKLVAPEKQSAELMRLIATYVVEGGKAIKDDAHMQWFELLKQEEGRRTREEQKKALNDKVSSFVQKIPLIGYLKDNPTTPENAEQSDLDSPEQTGQESTPSKALTVLSPETKAIAAVDPKVLTLTIPNSPGMLIKNRYGQLFEIQVDTITCSDRTRYLLVCPYCSAANLQGSWFCFRCGKQLTVKAASEELKRRILAYANSSFIFGILSILPGLFFLSIGAIPIIIANGVISLAAIFTAMISSLSSLTALLNRGLIATTLPALIFVALPSFLLGQRAISQGQQASLHLNLNFYVDKAGRGRASFGQAMGYLGMYLGIGLFVLVLISGYLRSGG